MAHLIVRARIIICLLSLLGVGSLAPQLGSAQTLGLPSLSSVTASTVLPDSIVVSGNGFTAGGNVYITLYDGWGEVVRETRWVKASVAVYGPNGSQDPAQGFSNGAGNIREVFELAPEAVYGPNGSQDPAQGYVAAHGGDRVFATAGDAVYGPNGSQDPAQGYVAGNDGGDAIARHCDVPLTVRAFDQQAETWSNLLEVEIACGQ